MSGNTYGFQEEDVQKKALPDTPAVSLLTNSKSNAIVGVDILNFFSNIEKKGRQAEQLFKQCLDSHGIPSLYIGQGLNGVEQLILSGDNSEIKRPDFLVTLPNFGHVFFDVKCRKTLGFKDDKNKYFYLDESDFEKLHNLQCKLMMPVWVAFGDADSVYRKKVEFYAAPIKTLHNYYQSLIKEIDDSTRASIACFLIPNELLCHLTNDDFSIRLISSSAISSIVKTYTDLHYRRIRFISESVHRLIREKSLLKTDAVECLFEDNKSTTTHREWDHFIKTDAQIKYKQYCHLRLR
jgi:hypothetical protein